MGEQPRSSDGDGIAKVLIQDPVIFQFKGMAAALWASRQRRKIFMLLVALVAVVGATAYAQIRLNAWNQPFYDALSHKNTSGFFSQLGVFAELACVLLALNVAQTWLNQKSKLVLRKGLVEDLLSEWLAPLRAFRISHAGAIGENPDQRIHEDARHLTELTDGPRNRPVAIDALAVELHRRPVGPVQQDGPLHRGTRIRRAGLHGLVRANLLRDRVVPHLARRPSARRAQRRTLCARSGFPLRPGAGE